MFKIAVRDCNPPRVMPFPMIGMAYTFCCWEDARIISSQYELKELIDELLDPDDEKKPTVYESIEALLDHPQITPDEKEFHRRRLLDARSKI